MLVIMVVVMVVVVFVATVVQLVIHTFVDESRCCALVDVEVDMRVWRLLTNSNCCQADDTAERTELHPF